MLSPTCQQISNEETLYRQMFVVRLQVYSLVARVYLFSLRVRQNHASMKLTMLFSKFVQI